MGDGRGHWSGSHPDRTRVVPFSPRPRKNLPVALTSFVGRTGEVADLGELLSTCRLLTLVGPGGCGKTRLALRVAETCAEPAEVCFVELAACADGDAVGQAIAEHIGGGEEPGPPTMDGLVDRLRSGRTLLVLDNCEHVLDATAVLVEGLLPRCASLTILATSREPMDLAVETCWRVPSLSLPASGTASLAEISSSEAVALFADRARSADRGFVLDTENSSAVAAICRRLDGMPLAIEFAAARIRHLTPGQIESGLGDAFGLLAAGRRTRLARHRTLEASMDWSHGLLTDPERVLFRRLAPLRGTFDAEAATALGVGAGLSADQVLDQLLSLVDKSLVEQVPGSGAPRYRLLAIVRHYAEGHLSAAGETELTRRRHRDHYSGLAARVDVMAAGPDQDRALDRMAADLDNFRVAFDWSRSHGDPEVALNLAASLLPLWRMRGRRAEGCAWLDDALSVTDIDSAIRIRALAARNRIETQVWDPAAADRVDECIRLARRLGDPAILARVLLGGTSYVSRDPRQHWALVTEAANLSRQLGDADTLLDAQMWEVVLATSCGEPARTERLAPTALAAATAAGNPYLVRAVRGFAAMAQLMRGHPREALTTLQAAGHEADNCGDRTMGTVALGLLGWAAGLVGERETARAASARSLAIAEETGVGVEEVFAHLGRGMAALAENNPAEARAAFERGWQLSRPAPGIADLCGAPLAEALLADGDPDAARLQADQVLSRVVPGRYRWQAGWALAARARIAFADDELGRAEDLAHQALVVRHDIGDDAGAADDLELLAHIALHHDSMLEAARLLGAAHALRAATGCIRLGVHDATADAAGTAVRAALDEVGYAEAFEAGAALSRDEAVSYAARGRGGRKRPNHGWAGLTPAEREVARLVAAGLPTKEIAARLFISPRTVQSHLTHAYSKLGVRSRVQLAQQAARHEGLAWA